jgi:hypothetical protein
MACSAQHVSSLGWRLPSWYPELCIERLTE